MSKELQERVSAEELKNYAKGHVTTVKGEFEKMVRKWERYLKKAADAQIKALERHKGVLTPKDESWLAGLAMLALTFVGGQALGWLGKMVTSKLATRYKGQLVDTFKDGVYGFGAKHSAKYIEVASEFWGDGVKELTEYGAGKALAKLKPAPTERKEPSDLAAAIMGNSLISFKTEIENAMSKEREATTGDLDLMLAKINQDEKFGYEILTLLDENDANTKKFGAAVQKYVDRIQPPPKTKTPAKSEPKPTPDVQSQADLERVRRGKSMLDDYFNDVRQKLAKKSFYFGNLPEDVIQEFLINRMELQMWKLWFLGLEFRIKRIQDPILTDDPTSTGKDGTIFNERILEHLVTNLGAQEGGIQDVYLKVYKRVKIAGMKNTDIDEEKDLQKVTNWAKTPPDLYLKGIPRMLPSITNPDAIFAGVGH